MASESETRESLLEEVAFGLRPEREEGRISHVRSLGESMPGRGERMGKAKVLRQE